MYKAPPNKITEKGINTAVGSANIQREAGSHVFALFHAHKEEHKLDVMAVRPVDVKDAPFRTFSSEDRILSIIQQLSKMIRTVEIIINRLS